MGARREVTGLALVVALCAGIVGLAASRYLTDDTAELCSRVASYFPPGPWRWVAQGVGGLAIAAVVLSALEVAVFWVRPNRKVALHAGDGRSIEKTLGEVRKQLSRCMGGRQPDVPLGLDVLLRGAMVLHASDIHFNPSSEGLKVTYRVDGILHDVHAVPPEFASRLTSRVKVLSRLDTYARGPQDGVLRREVDEIDIEARVSVLPSNYGERVVLRLVRGGEAVRSLDQIGFSPQVYEGLCSVLGRPQGLVIVSGPVGSGKTTSLYSALQYLHETRAETTALVSLEDPIELQLPFVTQTQVNPKIGMTFAQTLRSVLRQDPGALMVGEIRDRETAEIATQAGLTGHLILTTLHVTSAAATFTRLTEMGIEPYILATSCSAALAQRLVRGLCPTCKLPHQPTDALVARFRESGIILPEGDYHQPVGCDDCEGRGFAGRLPIAELLVVNDEIIEAIRERRPSEAIHHLARSQGMETLLESGLSLARAGKTSLDEVLRVAG